MASKANNDFSIGRPVRIARALREQLEGAIQAHLTAVEKLTAVLDRADGDAELEETGDLEPSLGGCGGIAAYDTELDTTDDEPSLATPEATIERQINWARGGDDDREADYDREPDDGARI